MSQSPLDAGEEADAYHTGWIAVSRLLRRGFSWSGHERDVAYSNRGGWAQGRGRFADVSAAAGLDLIQDGRAAVQLDWDLDGDLDLVVTSRSGPRARVLRNDQNSGNGWVALQLVGQGANRDAIGARVELTLEGGARTKLVATRRAGEGFLAQSGGWLHFGLGAGELVGLRVRWPSGEWEKFEAPRADRFLKVVQGSGRARTWPAPSVAAPLAIGAARAHAPGGPIRVVPRAPLILPSLSAVMERGGVEDTARFFGVLPGAKGNGTGQPVLISLFSHTCAPCAQELAALAARAEVFEEVGLDLLALCVDPPEEADQVRAFIERTGFRAAGIKSTVARATPETLALLDAIQSALLDRDQRLPVPTSFLVDHLGRLQVLYLGGVEPDRVLKDLGLIPLEGARREQASLPFPGRALGLSARGAADELDWFELALRRRGLPAVADEVAQGKIETHQVDEARLQTEFGLTRLRQDKLDVARKHFERALELDPTAVDAWKGLGYCRHRAGEFEGAREAYLRAQRFDPEDERNRVNLGLVYHALGDRLGVEETRLWLQARRSELLEDFERRVGD